MENSLQVVNENDTAIYLITKAEIDNQISTAKENGRRSDIAYEEYLKSDEHIEFLNDCKIRQQKVLKDMNDIFSGNVNLTSGKN